MSWILIALLAHFLYASVFVMDKFILARPVRSPLVYAFYPGFLGILIAVLVPFIHFQILGGTVLLESILAGVFFGWGLIYFYQTLKAGEASSAVPFVGALVPVATLVFSYIFKIETLDERHFFAFLFLVLGSLLVIRTSQNPFWKSSKHILIGILAAALLGLSFVFSKLVYNRVDFWSGFIWMRFGGFIFSSVLLLGAKWRKEIFSTTSHLKSEGAVLFLSDKVVGSAALILQSYAVSLGSVILVNALQSTQYVFILILASFLSLKFPRILKEASGAGILAKKILAVLIIGLGLWFAARPALVPQRLELGITFSPKFAEELGLDWKETYAKILDDLKVKDLRLIAYWDLVEPEAGKFDFKDLDWQIAEAQKRGAKIILVLGRKTPRWPECHTPPWAEKLQITNDKLQSDKFDDALFNYIETTVRHYKNSSAIWAWQVENEPLFPFGTCKSLGAAFLQKEIDLTRSLDSRPIILTDSGELGFAWPLLAARSDIFGTTLYRYIHNKTFGYIKYWFVPDYYFRLKAWWAQKILHKQILISELQAEPWEAVSLKNAPLENQFKTMNPQILREVVDYARLSGFPKAYFWGTEWWYWLKEKKGNPEMWEEVKDIIQGSY